MGWTLTDNAGTNNVQICRAVVSGKNGKEKAADAVPVVEKRRFADKATWTPTFTDTGHRHNFKEKYHYAFLSSGARIQHNKDVARRWAIVEKRLEELNQLRDKYDYVWSEEHKDLVKAHEDHLAARCSWRTLKYIDPKEKAQAAKEELDEQEETRQWLRGLRQVRKQEKREEAEAAKTKRPTAAADKGKAKLQGVGALEGAKATTPKSPTPKACLLYTSPSPRDLSTSRMPSSA